MVEKVYCVKCKAKTEQKDARMVTMKNGRPAQKGKCAVCGTTTQQIVANSNVPA